MFEDAITISATIGGCAAAVWYAKKKFQPEIDSNLTRIENARVEIKEKVQNNHKKHAEA